MCFFFNDTATTEIYTLSLHDALPISGLGLDPFDDRPEVVRLVDRVDALEDGGVSLDARAGVDVLLRERRQRSVLAERSEEHTSELQSRQYLVCRLLLEKQKTHIMFDR